MLKLPKEILELLPQWEYCCPKCHKYVKHPVKDCPVCSSSFDILKWRVPPRFLKNKKAMSKYVHKYLIPKLSPRKQKLILKYFTQIFSDGYESGDYSAWTGTNKDSDATLQIVTSPVHHGTKASESWVTDISADNAYAYYTDSSDYTTLYARAYFRFYEVTISNGRHTTIIAIYGTDGTYPVIGLVAIGNGSNAQWQLRYREDGGTSISGKIGIISLNTWYCVEIKVKMSTAGGGSDGAVEFWLDGTSKFSDNAVDNDDETSDVDTVRVGITPTYAFGKNSNLGLYDDCVVLADTYIGPEAIEILKTASTTSSGIYLPSSIMNLRFLNSVTASAIDYVLKVVEQVYTILKSATVTSSISSILKSIFNIYNFKSISSSSPSFLQVIDNIHSLASSQAIANVYRQLIFNFRKLANVTLQLTSYLKTIYSLFKTAGTNASSSMFQRIKFLIKNISSISASTESYILKVIPGLYEIFKTASVQASGLVKKALVVNLRKLAFINSGVFYRVNLITNLVKSSIVNVQSVIKTSEIFSLLKSASVNTITSLFQRLIYNVRNVVSTTVSALANVLKVLPGVYEILVVASTTSSAIKFLRSVLNIRNIASLSSSSISKVVSVFNLMKDSLTQATSEVFHELEFNIKQIASVTTSLQRLENLIIHLRQLAGLTTQASELVEKVVVGIYILVSASVIASETIALQSILHLKQLAKVTSRAILYYWEEIVEAVKKVVKKIGIWIPVIEKWSLKGIILAPVFKRSRVDSIIHSNIVKYISHTGIVISKVSRKIISKLSLELGIVNPFKLVVELSYKPEKRLEFLADISVNIVRSIIYKAELAYRKTYKKLKKLVEEI